MKISIEANTVDRGKRRRGLILFLPKSSYRSGSLEAACVDEQARDAGRSDRNDPDRVVFHMESRRGDMKINRETSLVYDRNAASWWLRRFQAFGFWKAGMTAPWEQGVGNVMNGRFFRRLPGRSERIRTSGPCVPNTVLYQAELHSDAVRG
ncbi:hypothetical protein AA23498_1864 [Acetobacter nitrogenifigens DSM 23921 = NBRC 105050]|nr:hypothetical protein AA23498_1864 [Acetobacter nitrogenifigens DSM 23921 = NBRC 105050]